MKNLKIYQPKIENCTDSFFYNDLLIATKKTKNGMFSLYATGEIALLDKKGELMFDNKPRNGGVDIEDDDDLNNAIEKLGYYFDMNNWFCIVYRSNDDNEVYDFSLDSDNYDDAIKQLKDITNN